MLAIRRREFKATGRFILCVSKLFIAPLFCVTVCCPVALPSCYSPKHLNCWQWSNVFFPCVDETGNKSQRHFDHGGGSTVWAYAPLFFNMLFCVLPCFWSASFVNNNGNIIAAGTF